MATKNAMLGILAGAAAGAVLGVLFAPDKGTSTRKKITQKSTDYVGNLGDKVNGFVQNMTTKFEALKAEAAQMVENGEDEASDLLAKGKSAVMNMTENGKDKANNLMDKGKDKVTDWSERAKDRTEELARTAQGKMHDGRAVPA